MPKNHRNLMKGNLKNDKLYLKEIQKGNRDRTTAIN